jgi:hypothetical protein
LLAGISDTQATDLLADGATVVPAILASQMDGVNLYRFVNAL